MKKIIAPYLKINGQSIEKGKTYYTVDIESLEIKERKAGNENNTINYMYYFDKSQAEQYVLENGEFFNFKDIEHIESLNLSPWQKRNKFLELAKLRRK